ncbi:transcriptional adapter ADA2-like [Chenopodium quinoa]|uniref:transcriptional adapter ADA2-like n=1 Tax=Chenopodium quinoa TaxID=63459 RepID=UPI000B78666F|nr:transcriptional adapter ADA2-like [Chenopodium quinoa]
MGRSRAVVPCPSDDDPNQKSKRKKAVSSVENTESVTAGQGSSDGKKALYHCNYCNKDISGLIRIKCVVCPDFDLCIECFSVGAEVNPHKSNHPYRVMDSLSFPLICPDWNADEESLLLEGIEMYGLGNWAEVAEHVGTKSKSECIDHYDNIYMNSPCFPLPDLSHVAGKNREELFAMAKEHSNPKATGPALKEELSKEESINPATVKIEEPQKEASGSHSSQAVEKPTNVLSVQDGSDVIKVEDSHLNRSVGEKKPKASADEGPPVTDLCGYNPKREEFEVEYDNDAEQLLADMEFKDTDTEAERDLKLKVLRIYNRRLDERKRRKDFVLERNLLYPDPFEKTLTPEEKELCQRYRAFMRYHSKKEHEELLTSVVNEHRIRKRLQDLQEAKAAGCRTSAEADIYIGRQRRMEAEENARKQRESIEAGAGGKVLLRSNRDFVSKDSASTTTGQFKTNSLDEWDITGFPGADLLSDKEKKLCAEIRILPSHYLNMSQTLTMEAFKGNITKKSDAHNLFKVDPSKVDRVYDMLVQKGAISQ